MLWHSFGGEIQIVLADASRKYGSSPENPNSLQADHLCDKGPLVRVGPNELVTSDPDALRRILAVRTRYRRSDWFDSFQLDPGYDNVFSQQDNHLHHQMRAKLAVGVRIKGAV